jgi:hypothetical protein
MEEETMNRRTFLAWIGGVFSAALVGMGWGRQAPPLGNSLGKSCVCNHPQAIHDVYGCTQCSCPILHAPIASPAEIARVMDDCRWGEDNYAGENTMTVEKLRLVKRLMDEADATPIIPRLYL